MKKTKSKFLVPQCLSALAPSKKSAFTLAEVLITLAIIGVVAAMTIPTLTANYKKKVVETRLARFYSSMNQALQLSSATNGYYTEWDSLNRERVEREDGSAYYHTDNGLEWFNKYLAPYIKTLKVTDEENTEDGNVAVYFPDGSLLLFSGSSFVFYPFASDYEKIIKDEEAGVADRNRDFCGIKYFTFAFYPKSDVKWFRNKGLVPFTNSAWDGTREDLLSDPTLGCQETVTNERAFCTKLIEMNGWKLPEDYPFKF